MLATIDASADLFNSPMSLFPLIYSLTTVERCELMWPIRLETRKVRRFYVLGLLVWCQVLDVEAAPAWVRSQMESMGFTTWRSRLAIHSDEGLSA